MIIELIECNDNSVMKCQVIECTHRGLAPGLVVPPEVHQAAGVVQHRPEDVGEALDDGGAAVHQIAGEDEPGKS